jgi:hypothetical protein
VGGALATLWAISQKVLTQIVLYGAPVISLYRELLLRAEKWAHVAPAGGASVVAPFALLVGLIGAVTSLGGYRAGRAALARRSAP